MSSQQKPKIISTRIIATSQIFEIESVDLKFSNGEFRTYERMSTSGRSGVMVLPIENGELLMIKEYAVGTDKYELGFVKGLMDEGETPEQSANRELKEEIGLGAKSFTFLRIVKTSPNLMDNPMYIFIARDLYPCQLEGDEPEPLELIRMPLNQIDNLLYDADFYEARNLTALYLLKDYLLKN